jgi:hypothetical protein
MLGYTHGVSESICETCGAPHTAGLAACVFCKTPYVKGESGVTCPKCGSVNAGSNADCVSCHESLLRPCIFCGGASPLSAAECVRCHEAFAGAAERKRARDEEQRQAQVVRVVEEGLVAVQRVAENQGVRDGLLGAFETLIDEAKRR